MALPSIALPTFDISIPSSGKKIKYRPFLVKEEKVLLMTLEGGDREEITNGIYDVLENCILTDNVNVRELPTFDIEYLFLNLRGKSVGEEITFTLAHTGDTECTHRTEVSVNIDDIKVQGEIGDGTIMVTDKIGLKMHYPNIESVSKLSSESNDNTVILGIIANCIDMVFDDNEVYEDFSKEELIEWMLNLNSSQFDKINEYFINMPKLKHTIKWKCKECGETDEIDIEGLYNFFI